MAFLKLKLQIPDVIDLNNFKYIKIYEGNKNHWKCLSEDKGCPVIISTKKDDNRTVLQMFGIHTHGPNENQGNIQFINTSVPEEATKNKSLMFKPKATDAKVEAAAYPKEILDKKKPTVGLPVVDPVGFKHEEFQAKDFYVVEDFIVSTWTSNLRILCSCNSILIEGVQEFPTRKAHYNNNDHYYFQVTLSGFKDNALVPLVFALMPNNNPANYSKLLTIIIKECSRMYELFQPTNIVIKCGDERIVRLVEGFWPNSDIGSSMKMLK